MNWLHHRCCPASSDKNIRIFSKRATPLVCSHGWRWTKSVCLRMLPNPIAPVCTAPNTKRFGFGEKKKISDFGRSGASRSKADTFTVLREINACVYTNVCVYQLHYSICINLKTTNFHQQYSQSLWSDGRQTSGHLSGYSSCPAPPT